MGGINCRPGKMACRVSEDDQEEYRLEYAHVVKNVFRYMRCSHMLMLLLKS